MKVEKELIIKDEDLMLDLKISQKGIETSDNLTRMIYRCSLRQAKNLKQIISEEKQHLVILERYKKFLQERIESLAILEKNKEVSFTDKYERVHDQEVEDGKPSSDHGWFYSAVYKRLGGQLNLDLDTLKVCVEKLKRHPIRFSLSG